MAKSKRFQDNISHINEIAIIARKRGVSHLNTENESLDGKLITINGNDLINFGSCSYLGLETDSRLKEASIQAIRKYGTQFSSSRTYVSFTLYERIEEALKIIFNNPVILSSTTSLGHQAVVPIIIADSDAVIMDHQAHASMQDTISKLQVRGISVSLLRHSRLDELQDKIAMLSTRHERVWYFIDGVYSMYGDLSPIKEISNLLDTCPSLYLYVDDAHGMSWAGEHGKGFILSEVPLHSKMVLSTSLAKGFASAGGVFVIPDEELYWRVKNWGGPLTYSGPQQPAVIGASLASAKIHLSTEIYERQRSLAQLIQYCNEVIQHYELPVVTPSCSPIFFIGLGLPSVGYSMIKSLMDDGFYTNLGIFPAVPKNCTGIRFTLTLHHNKEDINRLVERIAVHLPRTLREEGRTLHDVYKVFRNTTRSQGLLEKQFVESKENNQAIENKCDLTLSYETSIRDISQPLWDGLLGNKGAFDWNNLVLFEECFQNNERIEENWSFHYYIITGARQRPLLATFFVTALAKDDMLSRSSVSQKLESFRLDTFYHMTSRVMMMGTPLTEGQHLFLDKSHVDWRKALVLLLDTLWAKQETEQTSLLLLRDFEEDTKLQNIMFDLGFMKIHMPTSHIIEDLEVDSVEEYLQRLSSKKRYHIRKDALEKSEWFNIEDVSGTSDIDYLYQLYKNVVDRSFEINTFKFPKKLIEDIAKSPNWDIIVLKLKPAYDSRAEQLPVAVEFSYKRNDIYYPILIGLDYNFLNEAKVYKQLLYRIVERAIHLRCKKICFGLTASLEKRKLGAVTKSQIGYVQMKDTYDASLLNLVASV